jgi:outer membrane protein, heavy metal efflux system
MKMKNSYMIIRQYLIVPGLILLSHFANAQVSLDSLLRISENNNPEIRSAYQSYQNSRVRTNLFPENPEVEFGHMWGSPAMVGQRNDLSVSQSFDFPTVYARRSQLSRTDIERSAQLFEAVRQDILLNTKQHWIEMVFLNKRMKILEKRMDEAVNVYNYLQSRYEHGEISRLGLNRAVLLKAALTSDIDNLSTEQNAMSVDISYLSGGNRVMVSDTIYYPAKALLIDSVLKTSESDPLYRAHEQNVESFNIQQKLARAGGMPKIKTGYYSESVSGQDLRGVQLGLSIPLWENVNKVRRAGGEVLTAEMEMEKFRSRQESNIMNLFGKMEARKRQMDQLHEALQSANDPGLLAMAMESGEISILEYYFGTEVYYDVLEDYLNAEKEFYLAESELNKYDL